MIRYLILQDLKDESKIINTYEDWGLILGHKTIPLPTAKTELIENEGGDGTIDLTENNNDEVKYNDRVNKYPFTLVNKFADLPEKISMIANKIHGKRFKIFHYDDPDYYFVGRLSVNDFSVNRAKGKFVLEATCKPYKYKKNKTYVEQEVNGISTIKLYNIRKRAIPKITASSNMKLTFNDTIISITEGTHEYLNVYLNEGLTEIIVEGTGTIKFEYQECSM